MTHLLRMLACATVALAPSLVFAAPLDDGQIVEILHTANTSEIDAGKLASSKAKSAEVKSFASMMVHDHTSADKKGNDLASKLKIKAKDSDESKKLKADSDTDAKNLKAASAADFDRVYMDAMVAGHTNVLSMIDTQLIPAAKASELQSLLKEARTMVARHLDKAKSVRASIK